MPPKASRAKKAPPATPQKLTKTNNVFLDSAQPSKAQPVAAEPTASLTREEILKLRNRKEKNRLLRKLNIAQRAEDRARVRFVKNAAMNMPTIVAGATEAIKRSAATPPFKPHGMMTLAEYFGGLSFYTKIPKASLASLANVSERTISNWTNDFVERKERVALVSGLTNMTYLSDQ